MHSFDSKHWNWKRPQSDFGLVVVATVVWTSDNRTPSGGIVDVVVDSWTLQKVKYNNRQI